MTAAKMVPIFVGLVLAQLLANCGAESDQKPHIVVIMADDMGFDDVGFHGSDQIPTPNIDALATFGIALNRYYVAPMCTPSRSSLMTGRYPSNVGMQHYVIPSEQPWGLGLDQKLLPEYMHEGGYRTYAVGKWHLGFYMKRYTPTLRGFDSHFGYLGPYIDYFNHSLTRENVPWTLDNGYDMRKNLSVHWDTKGTYATDLFSQVAVDTITNHPKDVPLFMYLSHLAPHAGNEYDPLQVPAEDLAQFAYIKDPLRRTYAAMVARLDNGVGRVVDALRANGMLENSVVLFFSDNGSPVIGEHSNAGSNHPFKGQKDTPWEGAVRSAGAIWSPLLKKRQRTSAQMFHISDWLPTFAHLAGVKVQRPIDGHNIWNALSRGTDSPRTEVLCNLDVDAGYSSLVRGEWKYVNGSTYAGQYDDWISVSPSKSERHPSFDEYGESILMSPTGQALLPFSYSLTDGHREPLTAEHVETLRAEKTITCNGIPLPDEERFQCRSLESPCLFNVQADPCERRNLASLRPSILKEMKREVEKLQKSSKKPRNQPSDKRSNPRDFNGTWTWWFDELGLPDHNDSSKTSSPVLALGATILGFMSNWFSN